MGPDEAYVNEIKVIGTVTGSAPFDGKVRTFVDGQPAVEKKSVVPPEVTVTAAPKYNIRVSGNSFYSDNFDFQTGGNEAANKNIVNPLPDGSDITFDLKVLSVYKINTPKEGYQAGQIIEEIPDYVPLLWSYDEVSWRDFGSENKDGR